MNIKQNRLSMALDWALAKTAQLAISQPPDQEHISKNRRHRAVQKLRNAWHSYNFGRRMASKRSAEESSRRIEAAQAKRERRWARNLRIATQQAAA